VKTFFFRTAFVAIMHRLSHLQTANTSAHNEVKNGKRFFLLFSSHSHPEVFFFVGDSNIMMMGRAVAEEEKERSAKQIKKLDIKNVSWR
jgi:hypothetical protein